MSSRATILVVEHDASMRQLLLENLQASYAVLTAADSMDALDLLSRSDVDVVVTDTRVPGLRDTHWRAEPRVPSSDAPIVVTVGEAAIDTGAGAPSSPHHVVLEPLQVDHLLETVEDALTERRLVRQMVKQRAAGEGATRIIAESPAMQAVMSVVDRAAACDTPIVLVGESGTGKELLARALHQKSARARGHFVAVNCSAIPEALLENQLFGHRRGAFTDAREDQRGLFQEAHRGTILLDEIGDMAPALQGKLLRVLEEKEVHPLGAPRPEPVDVRIVAATHRDLDTLVADGRFRADLLYRINVIDIHTPPLRDRPDDLVPLIAQFLDKHNARLGRSCTVSAEAMAMLGRYAWPGNVRELENVIERALVLGGGSVVRVEDLPPGVRARLHERPARQIGRPLVDVEREHILRTLRAVAGNKSAAARVLGLDRKTLQRRLKHYKESA